MKQVSEVSASSAYFPFSIFLSAVRRLIIDSNNIPRW